MPSRPVPLVRGGAPAFTRPGARAYYTEPLFANAHARPGERAATSRWWPPRIRATSIGGMVQRNRGIGIPELRRAFAAGRNIMELLRDARGAAQNDERDILCSYDLQAGSYVASLANPHFAEIKRKTGQKLGELFASLGASVVCEAGVGEGTTLAEVVASSEDVQEFLGFDISLSRLLHARRHLASRGADRVRLFTGALGAIPLPDESVDLVYTFHSVEPNGGREREVLEELLRVARRHLVLVEPSNELGSDETRAHIEEHRFVKDLRAVLEQMGARVVRFEPWGLDANPCNQAALIVVEKDASRSGDAPRPALASPVSRQPLVARGGALYSEEDGLAFPVVAGIPCLLVDNGIVATQLADLVADGA